MLVTVPLQLNNPEVRASTQVNACGFIPSQWMVLTPANAHSLTDWLDQSADWGTGVGQSCQTHVHVCLVYLPEALAHAVIPHSFSTSFSICLLTLTSPSFAAPHSPHPSLRCWIIETDWSSCSQLCVRVERDGRKGERQKRGERYGGQTHPCLKRGFCRGPRAGCQVCCWCTLGRFLTLWE